MSNVEDNTKIFKVLTHLLGIDQESLLEYLNWCLLEHLVFELSSDEVLIASIKNNAKAVAIFKTHIERRTNSNWDVENTILLYERVKQSAEKHFRQKIKYEDLLRLLINSQLICSNPTCQKQPPEVILHIDHKFPVSRGGNSEYKNLQFLCEKCNLIKSDKLEKSNIWLRLSSLQLS